MTELTRPDNPGMPYFGMQQVRARRSPRHLAYLRPNDLIPDGGGAGTPYDQQTSFGGDPAAMAQQSRPVPRNTSFSTRGVFINGASLLVSGARDRAYFILQNTGTTNTVYLSFGQLIDTTMLTGYIAILAGGYYEPDVVPNNDVYAFSTLTTLCIVEG